MDPITFDSDEAIESTWRALHSDVRRKIGDESSADDIVQETWLRALRKRPRDIERLSAWLHVVSTRLIYESTRAKSRRIAREQAAARPERIAGVESAGSEASHLSRWVNELGEPYRDVVRMRYFDNLEIHEISARTRRSQATVRSQLKRGLDRLRERVGTRERTRSMWSTLPLLRIFSRKSSMPAPRKFAGWRSWRRPVAYGVCAFLAVVSVVLWSAPTAEHAAVAALASGHQARVSPPSTSGHVAERVEIAQVETQSAPVALTPSTKMHASGYVRSPDGVPVAGAAVFAGSADLADARRVATSDALGHYSADGIGAEELLWATGADACSSTRCFVASVVAIDRLDLMLTPSIGTLAVHVRDADGFPVADARVAIDSKRGLARTPRMSARAELEFPPVASSAITDSSGIAELPLPDESAVNVGVFAHGRATASVNVSTADRRVGDLEVTLPAFATITGWVVNERGEAIEGALVEVYAAHSDALVSARSDARGRVSFDELSAGEFLLRASEPAEGGTASFFCDGVLEDGARRELTIELSDRFTLRGHIAGLARSLAGQTVRLTRARGPGTVGGVRGIAETRTTLTDAAGHFVFAGCVPDVSVHVALHENGDEIPCALKTRVLPGAEEIVLERTAESEPSARLSVAIEAPTPELAPSMLELRSSLPDFSILLRAGEQVGVFETPLVPAGAYQLVAWIPHLGPYCVGRVELEQSVSATRRFELPAPGHLALELPKKFAGFGTARAELSVQGFDSHGFGGLGTLRLARDLAGAQGQFCVDLMPGEYDYAVTLDGVVQKPGHVRVVTGRDTRECVALGDTVPVTLVVRRANAPRAGERFELTCVTERRESRQPLYGGESDASRTRSTYRLLLPRAVDHLVVTSTKGSHGEVALPAAALASAAPPVFEIELANP
jgi:RNA polymerase sigma-70 factor (ECF subfamily)